MPSDEDLKRGYTISADGAITLLRPLDSAGLNDLFDHYPKQMASLQFQQVELEISPPPKPVRRSRISNTPTGYIFLVAWANACLLRFLMTLWFRRYRKIHGYNKGFYPEERDYGAGKNLQDFTGSPSPKFPYNPLNSSNFPQSPVNSLKSPLNSFIPAWLNPKLLDRLEAQLLDALRSTVANIEEGYARPTTMEYLNFLGYSQASLKEGKGDVQRMNQDGLLPSRSNSSLADLAIDLGKWHAALKKSVISVSPLISPKVPINSPNSDPGPLSPKLPYNPINSPNSDSRSAPKFPYNPVNSPNSDSRSAPKFPYNPVNSFNFDSRSAPKFPYNPVNSFNFGYPPVDNFDPSRLTYEMLIELINKTDWNLRQLAGSLENKLNSDQKAYQIERARIRGKVNWVK